jgi:2-iminobutanoate/2-iminopropanoate deaminase
LRKFNRRQEKIGAGLKIPAKQPRGFVIFEGEKMEKEILSTAKGFVSSSPLSQSVRVGNLIYISGQIPVDGSTMKLVSEDFSVQARRVLENLKGIVEAAGTSLQGVVKTTVFLTDMARFQEMNEIYREYFPVAPPARTCIGVKELPRNAQIEIEAIAFWEDPYEAKA